MNEMDYETAVKGDFKAKKIVKIDGVGVELSKFYVHNTEEQRKAREKVGLPEEAFIMLYAADLSTRKNQSMIFRALSRIKDTCPNVLVLMPGQPILLEKYKEQCEKLGITSMVRFLGYRRDIPLLLTATDCVISSSRQEGLPVNLIEAAASGKYIIATDVRGNADVVKQSGYGVLVDLDDDKAMAEAIQNVCRKGISVKQDVSSISIYDAKNIVGKVLELYE